MALKPSAISRSSVSSVTGVALFFSSFCLGLGAGPTSLGEGRHRFNGLVRESFGSKARAGLDESRLPELENDDLVRQDRGQAKVLSSLVPDRVVVLSAGRLSGAVLGSLVSVGDGVVAKIIDTRGTVSAAVVEQAYQGPIEALEGKYVRLFVVRP